MFDFSQLSSRISSGQLVLLGVGLLAVLGIYSAGGKAQMLAKYLGRIAFAIASILTINFLATGIGLFVGLNFLTLALAVILGLPGIVMLYGLALFF